MTRAASSTTRCCLYLRNLLLIATVVVILAWAFLTMFVFLMYMFERCGDGQFEIANKQCLYQNGTVLVSTPTIPDTRIPYYQATLSNLVYAMFGMAMTWIGCMFIGCGGTSEVFRNEYDEVPNMHGLVYRKRKFGDRYHLREVRFDVDKPVVLRRIDSDQYVGSRNGLEMSQV